MSCFQNKFSFIITVCAYVVICLNRTMYYCEVLLHLYRVFKHVNFRFCSVDFKQYQPKNINGGLGAKPLAKNGISRLIE